MALTFLVFYDGLLTGGATSCTEKIMKWQLPLLFLLSACVSNDGLGSSAVAENSIYGLSRVRIGMNQSQVLKIMHKPYKQETVEYQGNTYNVWFYVTRPTVLGQSRMVPLNLTPMTFENGVLVGWGFDYYNYILQEKAKCSTPVQPEKEQMKEGEGLEKTLENLGDQKPSGTRSLRKAFLPSDEHPPIPGQKTLSMSSKPPKGEGPDASSSPLDDDDERMLDDENDQNFDFW